MNIISQFNQFVEENFNKFLKNHFLESNYWYKSSSISNYINFMNDLDSFNYNFMTNVIKLYFEYIDDVFFNSSYRKKFCESKGFYKRTILTLFGEITYKRRYYYDKKYNDHFFFTDLFLNLPKRKYFDPFICSEICNESSMSSYSKAGRIVSSKVGKRINNLVHISRASSRNIVMNFLIIDDTFQERNLKRVERLYIMLDEKFVGSQFNDGKDHMIKAAVTFEDSKLAYKYKNKPDSMNRYKLIGSYTTASVDDDLLNDTINYIYHNYDVDYLKELNFMGDCALWIKNFPKSNWFKFDNDIQVNFSMDGFHFSQALKHLTTNEHNDVYKALYEYVLHNDKQGFTDMCNDFLKMFPERKDVIEAKRDYILNNWNERQLYQNSSHMKCSMESHISHIFADLFTSRPKAYSKKGIRQLLKLRLLKVNNFDIKQKYLDSLEYNPRDTNYSNNQIYSSKEKTDYYLNIQLGFLTKPIDNFINFIC